MSLLRRRMMMQKQSEWDYELYPTDGSEEGKLPFLRLQVKSGQKITIEYCRTKGLGYIYDARGCGLGYKGSNVSEIVEGTEILIAKKDGTISFAGHFLLEQQYETDIFIGKYIKIKIE